MSVLIAVVVMFALAMIGLNVVVSLFIGALVGGLASGMDFLAVIKAYEQGLQGNAGIALTYAMLGVLALCLTESGLPRVMADKLIDYAERNKAKERKLFYTLVFGLIAIGFVAETLVPVHIAFVIMIVPPLLPLFNKLKIDRRAMACVLSFGLVAGYLFFPVGFGSVYLRSILLAKVSEAGLDVEGLSVMKAMALPVLGMFAGTMVAVFVTYRKARIYKDAPVSVQADDTQALSPKRRRYNLIVALVAVACTFAAQLIADNSMLFGALTGIVIFMALGVVRFVRAETLFNQGMMMMAVIGFIMISASGFAEVMNQTGDIPDLVKMAVKWSFGSKAFAALGMLIVGLVITLGIGSSFSTVPIIAAIYVPLCAALGFSPLATVALIGTAGALGDTGSPVSDSTLGPSAGLNADGQHIHFKETVTPTGLHLNTGLLVAGWIAAMVL